MSLGSFWGPWGVRQGLGRGGDVPEGFRGVLEGPLDSFIFFSLEVDLSRVQRNLDVFSLHNIYIYVYICVYMAEIYAHTSYMSKHGCFCSHFCLNNTYLHTAKQLLPSES